MNVTSGGGKIVSQFVSATTLDTVRIECVGEARAVTCPGTVWVEIRDRWNRLSELMPELCQLLDGWKQTSQPGEWTEWDESVRQRLAEIGRDRL